MTETESESAALRDARIDELERQRDMLLEAAKAALHYMRLHKYADQAWADDLESAIAAAMTPNSE